MLASWLALLAPVLLASACCAAAPAGGGEHDHGGLHHMRSLRDIPFPRTLEAATALHSEAMRRSRANERRHGHLQPKTVAQPVDRVSPAGLLVSAVAAGSPIVPADFGADPTGAKDSTQAMVKAMAALLAQRGPRHAQPGGGPSATVLQQPSHHRHICKYQNGE